MDGQPQAASDTPVNAVAENAGCHHDALVGDSRPFKKKVPPPRRDNITNVISRGRAAILSPKALAIHQGAVSPPSAVGAAATAKTDGETSPRRRQPSPPAPQRDHGNIADRDATVGSDGVTSDTSPPVKRPAAAGGFGLTCWNQSEASTVDGSAMTKGMTFKGLMDIHGSCEESETAASLTGAPTLSVASSHHSRSVAGETSASSVLKSRPEVGDMLAALRDRRMHVVFSGSDACCVMSSTQQDDVGPLDVPDDAEAVLVLSDIPPPRSGRIFIRDLHETSLPPPIIVVLLRRAGVAVELASVAKAQKLFTAVAADDVVVQPSSAEELPLHIMLSLSRVESVHATVRRYEERIRELQEQDGWLFWRCVHMIINGFPKMQTSLAAIPKSGIQVGHHKLIRCAGKGGFGKVFESVNDETGEIEAIKVVPKKNITELRKLVTFWNEFLFLKRIEHPHITSGRGFFHGRGHLYLVMDFAGKMDLNQKILAEGGRLPEEPGRRIQRQIASALAHCHLIRIAHRDVKPDNIVISEDGNTAKLVDFGLALQVESSELTCTDRTGTMPYMSPEVLLADPYDPMPVDVWACGIVFLEMFVGVASFWRLLNWAKPKPGERQRMQDVQRATELFALCESVDTFRSRISATAIVLANQASSTTTTANGGACAQEPLADAFLSLLSNMLHVQPRARLSAKEIELAPWLSASS